MLPNVNSAVVEPAKVRDYLLSTSHPIGRFKAVVFRALGYSEEAWPRLRDDLLAVARLGEVVPGQLSDYGQKFSVNGILVGPNGRTASVTTVWLVPPGTSVPRFITAFPR